MTLLETRPTPWHYARAFWWNSRSEASRRNSFSPKYFFCSPENPLLPRGTLRTFSLSLSFHLSFPSPHLVKCWNRFLRTQRLLFTVAVWKITLCAICLVCFFRGWWFQPGLNGPFLLQRSRPAAYKCLKKEPFFPRYKTTSKLGGVKGLCKTQQTLSMSSAMWRWLCLQGYVLVNYIHVCNSVFQSSVNSLEVSQFVCSTHPVCSSHGRILHVDILSIWQVRTAMSASEIRNFSTLSDTPLHIHVIRHLHTGELPVLTAAYMSSSEAPFQWEETTALNPQLSWGIKLTSRQA